jgi:hypothetical protein
MLFEAHVWWQALFPEDKLKKAPLKKKKKAKKKKKKT